MGTALRTRRSLSQSPRVGEGASDTSSAFGYALLQTSPDGQASGGQGALPLCTPHQGAPGPGWEALATRPLSSEHFP